MLSYFLLISGLAGIAGPGPNQPPAAELKPVVVELFTSEGCSSCPPADRLLIELQETQVVPGIQVIPLGEHVDYWDRLGWKDPFSSRAFSDRQRDLGQELGLSQIYTPQMVINGTREFVGSRRADALRALREASEASSLGVELEAQPWKERPDELELGIRVQGREENFPGRYRIRLAITEDDLVSRVTRGENSGRVLHHAAVVRRLEEVTSCKLSQGRFETRTRLRLDPSWRRENLAIVVFVENPKTLEIVGAASWQLLATSRRS